MIDYSQEKLGHLEKDNAKDLKKQAANSYDLRLTNSPHRLIYFDCSIVPLKKLVWISKTSLPMKTTWPTQNQLFQEFLPMPPSTQRFPLKHANL